MVQGALAGLAVGGLYAVLAVCLTLMARLSRVINFTVAGCGMIGTYVASLATGAGLPVPGAIVLGLAAGAGVSAVLGLVIVRWLPDADISRRSAVTVAALLALISAAYIVFGNRPRTFPPLLAGPAFTVAGVVITKVALAMTILGIVTALASWLVLTRSPDGVRLRAISDRPVTAALLGIPVGALTVKVWLAVGFVATLAISLVAPTQTSDPLALSLLVIQAAAATLLGAFRRLDLAMLGGLGLGALQGALAQFQQLALLKDWLPLLLIVAFLLWTQRKEVWDVAR